MLSADNSVAIVPYDVKADKDLKILFLFYDQVDDQEWAVFDIRPIRQAIAQGKLVGLNSSLSDFMNGLILWLCLGR